MGTKYETYKQAKTRKLLVKSATADDTRYDMDTEQFAKIFFNKPEIENKDATPEEYGMPGFSAFEDHTHEMNASGEPYYCYDGPAGDYYVDLMVRQERASMKWSGKGVVKNNADIVLSNVTTMSYETAEEAYEELVHNATDKSLRVKTKWNTIGFSPIV